MQHKVLVSIEIILNYQRIMFLTGEVGLEKVIQHSYIENLDVAPGEIDLAGIDLELAHVKQGREVRLKQSLDKIKDYYDFSFY